ncbi:F0F1 ATP synthase subunit delta [Microvirga aerophila]|uniref:ATP synthase subunit delta n=1 Tax=Microvirga aerophila TaxID=670291 RepID=A0A512BKS3_9HYPH|nr:F0F1 ATP synthase subunit delta [Microvirga aerophila]GEO12561.1 ATP synthase subunit delta [Microvirga aerophila]
MAQSGSNEGPLLSGVALRYATALFDLASEANAVDAASGDLGRFNEMIQGSEDLQRLIRNPIFTAEEQSDAIAAILDRAGISGLAGNFIRLVAAKRRLFALPDMIRAYGDLVADAKGIVRAQVILAEEPSDTVMNEIKAALRDVAKADVSLDVKIDPSLIGGLIVKMGSRMVDASVRTKLNSIRLAMKEVR